jgi:hypothetical protein
MILFMNDEGGDRKTKVVAGIFLEACGTSEQL